ncbi:MAG: MgtC/SapB family protein [Sedimentisphaerales bacterium]|jgi:putative Mg2+ transporter-C (MgtC) family protein
MIWPNDLTSLILAAVFGAAIGFERELSGKAAGLRTNLLICLGATVFTIISQEMAKNADGSVTRIAAQIVTGVGFLGAGAIIQDRGGVHGLTTAATIWLVASIGMACGARFYLLATIATAITIVVLVGLGKLSRRVDRYREERRQTKSTDESDQEPI